MPARAVAQPAPARADSGTGSSPAIAGSAAAAFRRGLASDLLNVKVGLFWTALVPEFVSGHTSPALSLAMIAAMASMAFGWQSAYALLATRMSQTLKRRGSSRAINGTVGTVLVALGARLGLAHP